jgi:hypothetical protein
MSKSRRMSDDAGMGNQVIASWAPGSFLKTGIQISPAKNGARFNLSDIVRSRKGLRRGFARHFWASNFFMEIVQTARAKKQNQYQRLRTWIVPFVTDPGSLASSASAILPTFGLMDGQ